MHRFSTEAISGRREDGTLGLLRPESLGGGGPNLHYFLLNNYVFALMQWMVKPYSRRQLTRKDRITNYRIFRCRRVVTNVFEILVSRFRVLLGTIKHRLKVVRSIVFTCVVLYTRLMTQQGVADKAPTPSGPTNERVLYVPDDNYRTPSREAKHQV